VWGRLVAEKHTAASIDGLKIAFSSGALSVVNGHVVATKAGGGGGNDSDADALEGVSEEDDDDVW